MLEMLFWIIKFEYIQKHFIAFGVLMESYPINL